jgi:cysteine-rich repeat protein
MGDSPHSVKARACSTLRRMVKVLVVAVLSFWLAVVGCGYGRPSDVSGPTDCGDGELDDAEECDDGNLLDDDGCDSNCMLIGCGNGIQSRGEECDDGNSFNDDACVAGCILARCGDGFVQSGVEECDDGNTVTERCPYGQLSCIVCNGTCHIVLGEVSFCGDGIRQSAHEVCDDGNDLPCGRCGAKCQNEVMGGDCQSGVGCVGNADCASNVCKPNKTCQ